MNTSLEISQSFSLLYGDQSNAFPKDSPKNYTATSFLTEKPFNYFAQNLDLKALVILNQTHSTDGFLIKNLDHALTINPGNSQGDYLITDQPGIGLATNTADCLALTFYDTHKKVLGVGHAGWKGSVAGIAQIIIEEFINNYQSSPENIYVYSGPAARACCYEVTENVLEIVSKYKFLQNYCEKSITQRENSYFFDMPIFNKILLQEVGVPEKNIDLSKSQCTIHTPTYCSHRRDGKLALRQLTCAVLRY